MRDTTEISGFRPKNHLRAAKQRNLPACYLIGHNRIPDLRIAPETLAPWWSVFHHLTEK